jgi:hypothetical protein
MQSSGRRLDRAGIIEQLHTMAAELAAKASALDNARPSQRKVELEPGRTSAAKVPA